MLGEGRVTLGVRLVMPLRNSNALRAIPLAGHSSLPTTLGVGGCQSRTMLPTGTSSCCRGPDGGACTTPPMAHRKSDDHDCRRKSPSVIACNPTDSCILAAV